MHVSISRIVIRIDEAGGLRDKRELVRSIVETLHRRFNVSVTEVDFEKHPNDAALGLAAVGKERRDAREILERVTDALAAHPRAELLEQSVKEI